MSTMINKKSPVVAYLSLEIALDNRLKTYAGGLGVLAGDILKSAANLKFPLVGVSLLNRHGYFKQVIDSKGQQRAVEDKSSLSGLKKLKITTTVNIGHRQVEVGVWQASLISSDKFLGPVYFLDTNLAANDLADRQLTDDLYGGDASYRLKQEIVLGRGGLRILRKLGYTIKKVHVNETPGALAAIELYNQTSPKTFQQKVKAVRDKLVFTTHTSLYQDYDIFSKRKLLRYQPHFPKEIIKILMKEKRISFISLAAFFAGKINAVSKLHQSVSQQIFKAYKIQAITNGVNSEFWISPEFKKLYDKYLPGWREKPVLLKEAIKIPISDIWSSHQAAKKKLINFVKRQSGENLSPDVLTIGFARRFAPYKRSLLLFLDLNKLKSVARGGRGLQIIYAGKAHPRDKAGQKLIAELYNFKKILQPEIKIIFLPDYDLNIAQLMTAGVDVWLNTPLPPLEASGTSGMKAAHNGVPQLSTYDGWWPEGYIKNKTGWKIGEGKKFNLYELLANEILPVYYQEPEKWQKMMRTTIIKNAYRFSTDRVVREYIKKMY